MLILTQQNFRAYTRVFLNLKSYLYKNYLLYLFILQQFFYISYILERVILVFYFFASEKSRIENGCI